MVKILTTHTISASVVAFVVMSLVAGCASLPVMVPDMALKPPQSVRLEGKDGPLTYRQSRAVLARLQKNADETNIFDKHLAVEAEMVGSPLVTGNRVTLLVDGTATYLAMFAAIDAAKDHINLETFIIEDDAIGQEFIQRLMKKQHQGVQVNLIYDSVGSMTTPGELFEPLGNAGANILEFNPLNPLKVRKNWQVIQRDHRKLLIVDGEIAFVGGINISSVYSGSSIASGAFRQLARGSVKHAWRDTHLQLTGPVVSEFQRLFMATWEHQQAEPLSARNYFPELRNTGDEVVRAIGSTPEEPYSKIYVTLLSAINSAETDVFLTNAYFVPDPQFIAALKAAVQRGVDVRLLLPDKTDSALVRYASQSYYDELLSAGIGIYERQDALLHAKTAVIDGVWSTIGSTNLDWRSFVHNQEIDAVVLGQRFGQLMQEMFEADLVASKQVTLREWRQRSIGRRIKEGAARLWARYL
jgi:cardiolipin synthase A/B